MERGDVRKNRHHTEDEIIIIGQGYFNRIRIPLEVAHRIPLFHEALEFGYTSLIEIPFENHYVFEDVLSFVKANTLEEQIAATKNFYSFGGVRANPEDLFNMMAYLQIPLEDQFVAAYCLRMRGFGFLWFIETRLFGVDDDMVEYLTRDVGPRGKISEVSQKLDSDKLRSLLKVPDSFF